MTSPSKCQILDPLLPYVTVSHFFLYIPIPMSQSKQWQNFSLTKYFKNNSTYFFFVLKQRSLLNNVMKKKKKWNKIKHSMSKEIVSQAIIAFTFIYFGSYRKIPAWSNKSYYSLFTTKL